jgi:hypothetical protein
MTRITAIALFALTASAAAANDAYNQAVLRHHACTEAAATKLAGEKGSPYELASQALKVCGAEQAELARHLSREDLQRVLGNSMWLRMRTIREVRAGPQIEYCASCGFFPRWDDKLKVWRPYGR